MSGRNLRGAALGQSHYESQEIVDCFNDLIKPLAADLKLRDEPFTARDLSLLIGQLQQFQQGCLGAFNRPNIAPVRIPAKLFKVHPKIQLDRGCAIYNILLGTWTYRNNHSWKKWDFSNPNKKQRYADLIAHLRNLLIKKNFITVPKIAIMDPVSDVTRKTVLSLIKKIGASFVEKEDATHILHGKLHEYNKEGAEEDWFRTLEKEGPMVLVHWWYYPDSFDNWLPQTQQFADPEEPPEHSGPWHISVRWLQDTVKFNELMNEEDYEDVDEEEEEEEEEEAEEEEEEEYAEEGDESTSSISRKRKSSDTDMNIPGQDDDSTNIPDASLTNVTINTPRPISSMSEEPLESLVPVIDSECQPLIKVREIEQEKPQSGNRQRKNEFEPYLNGEIINISQFTAANVEYPRRPAKIQKLESTEKTDIEKAVDIPTLIKPTPFNYEDMSYPEWFDMSSVHNLEKLALPEFFKGDAGHTPENYMTYRDYMINTYKANPDYHLTVSACKVKLDTDLVTLVRIHSFLESQNLINSRTDPRRRIFDPYIDSDPIAQLSTKSQRNFKDIENADIQYLRKLIYNKEQVPHQRPAWNLDIEDPSNSDNRKIFHCSNCRVDCSEIRYQSLKVKNYQVCIDCFLEGRFPATFFSGDFLRVEDSSNLSIDEEWANEEIVRLLEGVDRYDDDWLLISEHVGSRSKEQCITQFLQLPINDEFLSAKLDQVEVQDLPFADVDNQVMALISYLSAHINPGVGAEAAKSALKVLIKSGEGIEEPMEVDTSNEEEIKSKTENDVDVEMEDRNIDQAFSKQVVDHASLLLLKSAAKHSLKLAGYEDQEIQHWTRLAVKTMVDKLAIKVAQYDELETSLETEHQELEKQQSLLASSIESLSSQHFPLSTTENSQKIEGASTETAQLSTNTTPIVP